MGWIGAYSSLGGESVAEISKLVGWIGAYCSPDCENVAEVFRGKD